MGNSDFDFNFRLEYVDFICGSRKYSFNVEYGVKYFEYVDKLVEVLEYFNAMVSGCSSQPLTCNNKLSPSERMLTLGFSTNDGPAVYSLDSTPNGVKETIVLNNMVHVEFMHTVVTQQKPAEIRKTFYLAVDDDLRAVSGDLHIEGYSMQSIVVSSRSDFSNQLFNAVTEVLNLKVVNSALAIIPALSCGQSLIIAQLNSIEDVPDAVTTPLVVSFSDEINAQINMTYTANDLLPDSIKEQVVEAINRKKVNVRFLSRLKLEN